MPTISDEEMDTVLTPRKRQNSLDLDELPAKRTIRPSTKALLNKMDAATKPMIEKLVKDVKRTKTSQAKTPDVEIVEVEEFPADEMDKDSDDGLDATTIPFTLSFEIKLGAKVMHSMAHKFRLNEVRFRDFNRDAIKKVEEYCNKARVEFEFESSKVTLSAKGINKSSQLTLDVGDQSDWNHVEGFLKDMVLTKRDVLAKWVFQFDLCRGFEAYALIHIP
jgi:hypothetical protein